MKILTGIKGGESILKGKITPLLFHLMKKTFFDYFDFLYYHIKQDCYADIQAFCKFYKREGDKRCQNFN